MKIAIFCIFLISFTTFANSEINPKTDIDICEKRYNSKKSKSWKLIEAYETKTLCGYKIKESNQSFEIVSSKDMKKSILPNNKNFNQDCEYSEPIDNEWNLCGIGVFHQAASYKKEKVTNLKF